VQEYVRRSGPDAPANLKTIETVAGELQALFQFLVATWG
jgi:hypothetical protein